MRVDCGSWRCVCCARQAASHRRLRSWLATAALTALVIGAFAALELLRFGMLGDVLRKWGLWR